MNFTATRYTKNALATKNITNQISLKAQQQPPQTTCAKMLVDFYQHFGVDLSSSNHIQGGSKK